jgi:hypothetical protein
MLRDLAGRTTNRMGRMELAASQDAIA